MNKILGSLLAGLCLIGCESKAGTGALIGGGAGTVAGVLISPTPAGALIGAGAGAATGAVIGAALEDSDSKNTQETPSQTHQKKSVSLNDIKKMTDLGMSDDKIIDTIRSTGSVYHLSATDIQDLKSAGVSKRVIDYMIKTGNE